VLLQQIAATCSIVLGCFELFDLLRTGADYCGSYLFTLYLFPQILFFVFFACHPLIFGEESLHAYRKSARPWFDIASIGFVFQIIAIISNFIFNTHSGHC
jgi:hypothetical protein